MLLDLIVAVVTKPPDPVPEVFKSYPRIEQVQEKQPIGATTKVASSNPAPMTGDVWYRLALCESGAVPTKNTGNGFYGMFQFSASTWNSMGTGYSRADLAPASVQTDAAKRLQARSGWGQWPSCSRKLGLR